MRPFVLLSLISTSILTISSCEKLEIGGRTPRCVEKKIEEYKQTSHCDDASVSEYWFQNKTVFTFEPGTCGADMPTGVIDANCNHLGGLGGLSGNSKINGENFSSAQFVRIVWQK